MTTLREACAKYPDLRAEMGRFVHQTFAPTNEVIARQKARLEFNYRNPWSKMSPFANVDGLDSKKPRQPWKRPGLGLRSE